MVAKRREFLQSLSIGAASLLLAKPVQSNEKKSDRLGELLPTRQLGRTGEQVTMLGLGGYHFGKVSEQESQKMLETALEGGVRFIDCATDYQNGGSEKRMGKLISPKYRDVVYLMSKTEEKDAKAVEKNLDETLKRMNTDYLDLWQVHAIQSIEDVDNRIEEGVLEVVQKAQESGKVRHIGFTGHRTYKAHLHMMEKTDIFQTCQLPINAVDPSYHSFIENVLPVLVKKNIGVIAMKTLGFGAFLNKEVNSKRVIPDTISLQDALHFVWSLPISTLVTGAESAAQMQEKIDIAKSYSGMSEDERQAIIAKVAGFIKEVEYYKV